MTNRRRTDTRARILRSAGEAFLEHGFVATLTDEIAARGGVSKGTLYLYFHNKAEMFEAFVAGEITPQSVAPLDPLIDTIKIEQSLRSIGQCYLLWLTRAKTIALLRVVIAEANRFPKLAQAYGDHAEHNVRRALDAYLTLCVDKGTLKISDVSRAAAHFLLLCRGDLMLGLLLGLRASPAHDEIESLVGSAVAVFMAAYSDDSHK